MVNLISTKRGTTSNPEVGILKHLLNDTLSKKILQKY